MLDTSFSSKSSNFQQRLSDAIAKIKITDDLSIIHPDYPTLPAPTHHHRYLQQMTEADRDRYLTHKLQRYLYDIFMERVVPPQQTQAKNEVGGTTPAVNCGDRWYETEFYRQLVRSNHGRGYSDPNWSIVYQSEPYWQVTKNGLTINIDPKQHLVEPAAALKLGDTTSIKLPANLIDHGHYIAVGNAGSVSNRRSTLQQTILQLYFNTDSSTALKLLDCLTKQLNILEIPFDFRLSYRETDFPNPDAAILEFSDRDWLQLQPIIKQIYLDNYQGFESKIPFFCQMITSGIGLAEKPFLETDELYSNLGDRYCKLVALAIVKTSKNCDMGEAEKTKCIIENLSLNRVPAKLYLNPGSKASYEGVS